ncbi:hypothetical protein HCY76_07290 [Limosilactobacillus fermentum]
MALRSDGTEMKTMGMNGEKLTVDIKLKGLKDVKEATKAFRKLNQELEKTIQFVERLDDLN